MSESGETPALFCPKCGYNLTGLIEQRCPECGVAFDLQILRAASGRPKPIRAWAAVLQLILPPLLLWPLLLLMGGMNIEWLAIPAVLMFIGYSLMNSVEFCQRISATLHEDNPFIRGLNFRYCLMGFGFIAFQWGLAICVPMLFFGWY